MQMSDHFSCLLGVWLSDTALLKIVKIMEKTAFFVEKKLGKMAFMATSRRFPAFLEYGLNVKC